MTDVAASSAFWANPIFWQSVLLAVAALLFGLAALMVRIARLNRNIKALALRLATLESRPGHPAPLPQKMAPLPKTNDLEFWTVYGLNEIFCIIGGYTQSNHILIYDW